MTVPSPIPRTILWSGHVSGGSCYLFAGFIYVSSDQASQLYWFRRGIY